MNSNDGSCVLSFLLYHLYANELQGTYGDSYSRKVWYASHMSHMSENGESMRLREEVYKGDSLRMLLRRVT